MRHAILIVALLATSGCALGPRPVTTASSLALPPAFSFAPSASEAAAVDSLLPLEDRAFITLRDRALAAAPDLAAALARVDAARAATDRAGAERLPEVDGDASIARRRQNTAQFGPAAGAIPAGQTVYGANISARWDLDLFGTLRARERAARERLGGASAEAAAVRLALVAEVASSVTDWRTLQSRESALREDLDAARELGRLAGVRERAGLAPGADRVRAEALAAASASRLEALGSERARLIGRLVTLTAQGADGVVAALAVPAPVAATGGVPTALPSTLLTNRPDVLAAGARLRAADADLAAAAAARFPRITLSAGLGLLGFSLGQLFETGSIIGNLTAGIAGPILDFGRLRADEARARAGSAEALANYRGAVFGALGEAESGYALVASAAREAEAARVQQALDRRSARLVETRFRAGLTDFRDVLEARRGANSSGEAVAAAEGRLSRARVLLWQALGGAPISAV